MLPSILAVLICTAIPVSDPLQITAQMPPDQPAVEVGTYLTATSFRCRNFSSVNYLLVFGQNGTSSTVIVPLPAHAAVAYDFSPQELQGVYIEVVSAESTTNLVTSGSLPLVLPQNSSAESLWFVQGIAGLVTWQQTGCDVERVRPTGTLLPANVPASDPGDGSANAMMQAPIAVPTGNAVPGGVPQQLPPM